MRHDDDGEIPAQLAYTLLDFLGGYGVESAGGFVHEQDVGLNGKGSGNAQPLLLAAGHAEGGFGKPVLDLVKNGGALQGLLDPARYKSFVFHTVDAQPVGHVFVNGLGKRIGLLENHAHTAAQLDHIGVRRVHIPAVEGDAPRHLTAGNEVVHTVETAEKGGFAAAGRADEGRDHALREIEVHVMQSLFSPVGDTDVIGSHAVFHTLFLSEKCRP